MRGRRLAAGVAVVAVVAVAVTLHASEIVGLQRISHDDTISYLAATGHQGAYHDVVERGADPVAEWVPARRWQAFTRVDAVLPLLTIARDLGHHDIHPPVYFWLLHVWSLLTGVHLWSGPLLNVLLHLATGVVLWRLALRLTGSRWAAWAATGVWATLPGVAETAVSTRQYSLAALLSIALGAVYVRTRGQPAPDQPHPNQPAPDHPHPDQSGLDRRGLLALAALTAVGMLTLYTFGLVVAGLGLVTVLDLRDAARRRAALAQVAAFAAGGAVFLAGQPWLPEVLRRQQEQLETPLPGVHAFRVEKLLHDLPGFAVSGLLPAAGAALLLATAVLAVLAWRIRPAARPLVWVAVWVPAVMAALYVAVRTPGAASEARYFSIALPYVALLPVLAWPYLRSRPVAAALAGLCTVAAISNVALAVQQADAPPPQVISGQRPVVLDNLARGVLLRILWDAPPDTPVYAADQSTLLRTTERWLECPQPSPCTGRELTLASQVQYESTAVGQRRLLSAADEVREVTPEPPLDDLAERSRLSAPIAGGGGAGSAAPAGLPGPAGPAGGVTQSGARSRTTSTMTTTSTSPRSADAAASMP